MIDDPKAIALIRAVARQGALRMELDGLRRGRGRSAYAIVKEVYGFRGSRASVLDDLTEYIDAEHRLMDAPDELVARVSAGLQERVDVLEQEGPLTQIGVESDLAFLEESGRISAVERDLMSDMFYVAVVRQIARNR